MSDQGHTERLAATLNDAVSCLRQGKSEEAKSRLEELLGDEVFMAASDLQDVHARVWSLHAQAALDCEAFDEALASLDRSESLDPPHPTEPTPTTREALRKTILEERKTHAAHAQDKERLRRLADVPIEALLMRARSPFERCSTLVERANAAAEVDRMAEAVVLARQAIEEAQSVGATRDQVLGHLIVARAEPSEAQRAIDAAIDCAERAGEPRLLSVIATAAKLCGATLPTQQGPTMSGQP